MSRTIRRLRRPELDTLLDWAALEGWNPGLKDADAFWAADPNGFIGAFVDDVMVAAISAVAYDDHFGFIGLYICDRNWRGQGHGKAVWDAGMEYLRSRTIGLDGVPEQQANYEKMGFVRAYDTIRMSGTLPELRSDVVEVHSVKSIMALDRRSFPASRPAFLAQWLRNLGLAVMRDGRIRACAVRRPCRGNDKIGPLFAESVEDAKAVLGGFAGAVEIDVPQYQTAFIGHLEQLGFAPGFTTARMYRGPAPDIARDGVFGVSTLELG